MVAAFFALIILVFGETEITDLSGIKLTFNFAESVTRQRNHICYNVDPLWMPSPELTFNTLIQVEDEGAANCPKLTFLSIPNTNGGYYITDDRGYILSVGRNEVHAGKWGGAFWEPKALDWLNSNGDFHKWSMNRTGINKVVIQRYAGPAGGGGGNNDGGGNGGNNNGGGNGDDADMATSKPGVIAALPEHDHSHSHTEGTAASPPPPPTSTSSPGDIHSTSSTSTTTPADPFWPTLRLAYYLHDKRGVLPTTWIPRNEIERTYFGTGTVWTISK